MSLRGARNAARQGNQNATVTAVMGLRDRCSRRPVPNVVKARKSHSSLVAIGRFIVAIATVRSDLTGNVNTEVREISI
jgi:hypothetical protein